MTSPIELKDKNLAEVSYGACYQAIKYNTSMDSYFIGGCGEATVYQYMGEDYKFNPIKDGGDGGVDIKSIGAQVKTNTWDGENKMLKVPYKCKSIDNDEVKVYIQVYFDKKFAGRKNFIVGQITKEDFINKKEWNKTFKCWTVNEDQLEPFKP